MLVSIKLVVLIQSSDVYTVTLTFNYQLEVWLLVLELRHPLSFFFVQRWMPHNNNDNDTNMI